MYCLSAGKTGNNIPLWMANKVEAKMSGKECYKDNIGSNTISYSVRRTCLFELHAIRISTVCSRTHQARSETHPGIKLHTVVIYDSSR